MQLQVEERSSQSPQDTYNEPYIYTSSADFEEDDLPAVKQRRSKKVDKMKILIVVMLVIIAVLMVDIVTSKREQSAKQSPKVEKPKGGYQQTQKDQPIPPQNQNNQPSKPVERPIIPQPQNPQPQMSQPQNPQLKNPQPIIPVETPQPQQQTPQTNPVPQEDKQYKHHQDCAPFEEKVFHYFNYQQDRKQYYFTRYGVATTYCFKEGFGLVIYSQWSQEREPIQWAYLRVAKGQKVFFDCKKCTNYDQMVILSRLVGPQGQVSTTTPRVECMTLTFTINSVNIGNIYSLPGLGTNMDVLITTDENYFSGQIASGVISNGPKKILVKLTQNSPIRNYFNDPKLTNYYDIHRLIFNSSDCESNLVISNKLQGAGYYEFIGKGVQPPKEQGQQISFTQQYTNTKNQYEKYKKTLPSPVNKKDINLIGSDYKVKLEGLDASQEEKEKWSQQKEVIEWAKNRTQQQSSTIFYELSTNSPNLYVVLNLASLVPKGKITIICFSTEMCGKILTQGSKYNINNLETLPQVTFLPQANLIITDNTKTVQFYTKQKILGQQFLLNYIKPEEKQAIQLLYWMYARYRIRKVSIFPSFYFGYEVFDHFLWHSEQPSGFYEIEKPRYTIYQAWGGSTSQLTPNRRYNLKQMFRSNTPEVKVLTPTTRPYFQLPDHPFHKAFQYLSVVHQADYLRNYMMRYYGGGYNDIKHVHFDFQPYFQKLYNGPENMLAIGYHEVNSWDIACTAEPGEVACDTIKRTPQNWLGNDCYIFKKNTPLVENWLNRSHAILDNKYEALKQNPAQVPRDKYGSMITVNGVTKRSNYPLNWAQINGEILIRAQWDNAGKFYLDMPFIDYVDYQ